MYVEFLKSVQLRMNIQSLVVVHLLWLLYASLSTARDAYQKSQNIVALRTRTWFNLYMSIRCAKNLIALKIHYTFLVSKKTKRDKHVSSMSGTYRIS